MKETLTNKQIAFVIFQLIVGYGIIGLPKKIAELGGTGGWIIIFLSTLIFIFITNVFLYLGHTHKNQTLYEYSESLVGKYLSKLIVVVYIFHFTLFSSSLIRVSSETIKLTVFEGTPVVAFNISFFLIIYYTIIKRLRVFSRLSEIYGIIFIAAILLIQLIMFTSGDYVNLRPFIVVEDIPTYFSSIPEVLFSFYGVEIIIIIPLCAKNNKNVFKYSSIMMGIIGILYIIIVESCISLMGVDSIINYDDALFVAIRRLDIAYLDFFRRPDGIFMMAWILSLICTMIGTAYGAVALLSKLFHKISFNLIAAVYLIISFLISSMPKTIFQVNDLIAFVNYFGVIPVLIIPLILSIITKVKSHAKT